jgi:transposase
MDVLYPRCCGLDVHKKTVAACLITSTEGPEPVKEIRTFRTMTADLLALADWLEDAGCTHVANRAMTSFTLVGHSADFTLSVPTGISPGG